MRASTINSFPTKATCSCRRVMLEASEKPIACKKELHESRFFTTGSLPLDG